MQNIIPPKSGVGFKLKKGKRLKVIDVQGEQVSDFFAFIENDHNEYLSSGRTLDYLSKIYVGEGDLLYSNQSRPIAKIVEDQVKRHDFLLTPCSKDTFRIIYGDENPAIGCEGNLLEAFSPFGIHRRSLPSTLNLFMHVDCDHEGKLTVKPPLSQAGQYIVIEALEDLIVGLTACSALQSNNFAFKPIGYEIL